MEENDRLPLIKKTRTGVIIMIVSVVLLILSVVIPPISFIACFSQIFVFVGSIGPLVGLAFISMGSKAYSKQHQTMTKISLLIMVISYLAFIIILSISMVITASKAIGMDIANGADGNEVQEFLRSSIPFIWIMIIPTFIMMTGQAVGLWGISPKWGKITLAVFIVAVIGSLVPYSILAQAGTEEVADEVDPDVTYDQDDLGEFTNDISIKVYTAGMMKLTYLAILLIGCISCLIFVGSSSKDAYING